MSDVLLNCRYALWLGDRYLSIFDLIRLSVMLESSFLMMGSRIIGRRFFGGPLGLLVCVVVLECLSQFVFLHSVGNIDLIFLLFLHAVLLVHISLVQR